MCLVAPEVDEKRHKAEKEERNLANPDNREPVFVLNSHSMNFQAGRLARKLISACANEKFLSLRRSSWLFSRSIRVDFMLWRTAFH